MLNQVLKLREYAIVKKITHQRGVLIQAFAKPGTVVLYY